MIYIYLAVAFALILGGGLAALKEMKRHEEAKAKTRAQSLKAAVELTEILHRECPPRAAGHPHRRIS